MPPRVLATVSEHLPPRAELQEPAQGGPARPSAAPERWVPHPSLRSPASCSVDGLWGIIFILLHKHSSSPNLRITHDLPSLTGALGSFCNSPSQPLS